MLGALAWRRGEYLAGFEVLGAADGVWAIHKVGICQSFVNYWHASRDFQYWNSTNSILWTMGPGLLATWCPSVHWGWIFGFVLYAACLMILGVTRRLDFRVLTAAVLASPVISSFTITGFPYLSCAIPWVFGIVVLLGNRSVWWFLPMTELTFHCYEFGRTVFILPLIAAFTLPMSLGKRFVLSAISGAQAALFFGIYQSTGPQRFVLFLERFGDWQKNAQIFLQAYPNLWAPALWLGAVLAVIVTQRNAAFWRVMLLVQTALVVIAILEGDADKSRRFIMLDFVSIVIVAHAWRELSWLGRVPVFIGVLVTLSSTWHFVSTPIHEVPLPYVKSASDFHLNTTLIDWSDKLSQRAKRYWAQNLDGKIWLDYGYDTYQENTTDPQGVPERILLKVGPRIFGRYIRFTGSNRCRFSCLPMYARGSHRD